MQQVRWNWCIILHVKYSWLARLVHSDETDKVDITAVAIEAIESEKFKQSIFASLCSFAFHFVTILH